MAAFVEIDMKTLQGKGMGAGSTKLEAKLALSFLPKHLNANPVVLDVGACTGSYTEAILEISPNAIVYAFEPSSKNLLILNEKFISNDHIAIQPFALGDEKQDRLLFSDFSGSALASFSKRRLEHAKIKFDHTELVSVQTLDNYCKLNNIKPNLIKIDVEGHELDVLRGGLEILTSVNVVQFEFGGCNIDTRTFFQDFWYLLTKLNFSIFRISSLGAIHIPDYSEEEEYFRTTNYLAVRK
jgi:FkbM family methyltransferase